jgi:hypothetical protein
VTEVILRRRHRLDNACPDLEVRGKGWWVVIENKLWSSESEGQTQKYAEHYRRLGKRGRTVFPIFLTPDGRSAASRFFFAVPYRTFRRVLEEHSETGPYADFVAQVVNHLIFTVEAYS